MYQRVFLFEIKRGFLVTRNRPERHSLQTHTPGVHAQRGLLNTESVQGINPTKSLALPTEKPCSFFNKQISGCGLKPVLLYQDQDTSPLLPQRGFLLKAH